MIKKKKVSKTRVLFLLFCIAAPILNFFVFYVYPNLSAFTMAFTNNRGELSVDNFLRFGKEIVNPNSDIRIAIQNTLLTFGIMFVTFPLKVLVSYFIYKKVPFASFYRVVFFIPMIVFSVAVAMVFIRMVGPNGFIAKLVANILEMDYAPELLADSKFANTTVLLNMMWLQFPGDLVIWGGTFARIPEDVLESARLDGVTWWTEFTKIIVPMIWPTVALQMVLLTCGLFGASGNVWLLTQGEYKTMTISAWMYRELYLNSSGAHSSNVYNYLSAVGLIITAIAITLSTIVRKWSDKAFDEVEF